MNAPNDKFAVYWRWNEKDECHEIWMKMAGNDREQLLFKYYRHASVLWAPDGNKLVINDVPGSDFGNIHLFKLDKDMSFKEDISIGQMVQEKVANTISDDVNHLYIEGTKWIDNNTVVLKVHGHGNKITVDMKYNLDIENRTLVKIG